MLPIILGLVGAGGIGAALFLLPGLRLALLGIARAIPPKVWLGLAVLAVLGGGIWLHQRHAAAEIETARKAGHAAGVAEMQRAFAEMQRKAGIYKQGFLAVSQREADQLRSRTDEVLRRNSADADDLRLHGPGFAAATGCGPVARPADRAAAGGPGTGGGPGDAPLAPLPDNDAVAIVPWLELTRFAEQHDRYRTERAALIEHIDTQNRLLGDLRAQLEAAVPTFGKAEPVP